MRRKLAFLFVPALLAGLLVGIGSAQAHQCEQAKKNKPAECRDTEVYPDWRPNYIPLFDLPNRDDPEAGEQERYDAQRWRDECDDDDDGDGVEEQRQQCQWLYGGTSVQQYPSDDGASVSRPNELHVGYAANHCFLAEAAHDCDNHGTEDEFATHDSHGGAVYADVCLSPNPDSRLCDDGMQDTQVGVTVVDHLPCPWGCFDEYHVVRPFDTDYTTEQMADSQAAIATIPSNPEGYACGYHGCSSSPM
jgi:hypothetical protein